MFGGYVGPGNKSVIPKKAVARLSMRLVPNQNPEEIAHLFRRHFTTVKPPSVTTRLKITGGSPPVIISLRHPPLFSASRALYHTWGLLTAFTRSGGTMPFLPYLPLFAVPV